jgi:hypothetical protein
LKATLPPPKILRSKFFGENCILEENFGFLAKSFFCFPIKLNTLSTKTYPIFT